MKKLLPIILSCMLLPSPTYIENSKAGFLIESDKVSVVSIYSQGDNFKEDIEISVKTQGEEIRFSPEVDIGYFPNVFIGNFLDNGLDQILYSVNSGGSGAYSFYQIFSLKGGTETSVFDSNDFNPLISASYIENDIIEIDYQGKKLYLDSSTSACDNKEDCSLTISAVNTILPYYNIELDRYYLQVLQKIYGGFTANNYGYIVSLLEVNEDGFSTIDIGVLSNFDYGNL